MKGTLLAVYISVYIGDVSQAHYTVQFYATWNLHEPEPGVYNFEGFADIETFLEIANDLDLLVLFRPGPYACGEWEFGGFPWWLGSKYVKHFFLRSFLIVCLRRRCSCNVKAEQCHRLKSKKISCALRENNNNVHKYDHGVWNSNYGHYSKLVIELHLNE